MKYTLTLLCAFGLFTGCDSYTQDDYQPEYVVEAYLIAGERLPQIRLSTTAPIESAYRFEDQSVRRAEVAVALLDEAGVTERYPFGEAAPGVYAPIDPMPTVQAGRRYALEIVTEDDHRLAAETLVPGDFELFAPPGDTLVYQQEATFNVDVTESAYPNRAAIYILKLHAVDTSNALTPIYAGWVDDEVVTRKELVDNNSGILNEANFERVGDGRLRIVMPWIAVAYFGDNDVYVDAIDDNLFDFIRTREDNGTRPLGERENILDHIDGGRGVFGSLVRRQVPVYIRPD